MKKILHEIIKILLLTLTLSVLCGLVYPLLLTAVGQTVFSKQANGSVIVVDGKKLGSKLVGQHFTDQRFMKCRSSAVQYNTYTQEDIDQGTYTGVSSGSNNYAPSNKELSKRVLQDIDAFLKANPSINKEEIPVDLITASGSGLDPHISPAAAAVQILTLAQTTGLSQERLLQIVNQHTQKKVLGIFGEETVNVLEVNIDIARDLHLLK